MRRLEAKAIDEALYLFQGLMATRLISTARRATEKERRDTGETGHESILTPVSAGRHVVSDQP
ncbi:hypothetical protein [Nonomuraea cavernae]|uniref:hypothetical protein n=1 Tax=Nonomuraea cavernae TaxID=2045107 RepID=UPI003407E11E